MCMNVYTYVLKAQRTTYSPFTVSCESVSSVHCTTCTYTTTVYLCTTTTTTTTMYYYYSGSTVVVRTTWYLGRIFYILRRVVNKKECSVACCLHVCKNELQLRGFNMMVHQHTQT